MTTYRNKGVGIGQIFYWLRTAERNGQFILAKIVVGLRSDFSEATIDVTAQADAKRGEVRYYGTRLTAEMRLLEYGSDREVKLIEKLHRAVRAVQLRAANPECELRLVMDALAKLKAVHAVYDDRISQYVPVADVLPPEYSSWRDDWDAMGRTSGCTWAAEARDADEARALITLQAKASGSTHTLEYYEQWKAAGMPVKNLTQRGGSYQPPKILTLDNLFMPLGKEEVAA